MWLHTVYLQIGYYPSIENALSVFGIGMASVLFTGKRRFLVLISLCTPPSSPFKVDTGPRTWSQETCVPVLALKSAGHVIMDRSSGSLTCFCIHKMRRTAAVAEVLALHFSGFRILWTRMISLGLSTPLSSTLVCGTAMLLLDVQGTEKEESFFCFFFF